MIGKEIVDQERFLYKRRISEMLHIQLQKTALICNLTPNFYITRTSRFSIIYTDSNCASFLLLFLSNNLTYVGNTIRFTY